MKWKRKSFWFDKSRTTLVLCNGVTWCWCWCRCWTRQHRLTLKCIWLSISRILLCIQISNEYSCNLNSWRFEPSTFDAPGPASLNYNLISCPKRTHNLTSWKYLQMLHSITEPNNEYPKSRERSRNSYLLRQRSRSLFTFRLSTLDSNWMLTVFDGLEAVKKRVGKLLDWIFHKTPTVSRKNEND